ncbi:MAG: hypothetical protein QW761_01330 [Candidatus Aenigmatarchaeota archaeon]
MFRKLLNKFSKPKPTPYTQLFMNLFDIMRATIEGSERDIKQIDDKRLLYLRDATYDLLSQFYVGTVLSEIKCDIEKLIASPDRKLFRPFYNFPPTLFHMAKYVAMHKLMSLKGWPLKPHGAETAWQPEWSREQHAKNLEWLYKFNGKFSSFKLRTKLPFFATTRYTADEIKRVESSLRYIKPQLKGDYLLKYYAFVGLELSALGFVDEEKKIDIKFSQLSAKDKNFNRYLDYKLFLLKLLAVLRVAKPEILSLLKLEFPK